MAVGNRIIREIESYIDSNMELSSDVKGDLKQSLRRRAKRIINILLIGAAGCGKSSTINALFEIEKAKVGTQPYSETMDITKYELDNLVIWDTPGLGDDLLEDDYYSKVIANCLNLRDTQHPASLLIDLVLVILDGSARDFGTSYRLINDVIIPNLGDKDTGRILVAINQADVAMKGRNWNAELNLPETPLIDFLEQKVKVVKERIYQSACIDVDPIYYSAGYTEPGKAQEPGYNIAKLLYHILSNAPAEKRPCNVGGCSKESEQSMSETADEGLSPGERSEEPLGAAIGGLLAGIVNRYSGNDNS